MALFQQCVHGNYAGVEELRSKAVVLQQRTQQSVRAPATNPSDDEDSSSDDEDDESDNGGNEGGMAMDEGEGHKSAPQPVEAPVQAGTDDAMMEEGGGGEGEEEEGWHTVGKKSKKPQQKGRH